MYIVVTAGDPDKLARLVNDRMLDGYVPQGGVAVKVVTGSNYDFYQAMIKEKDCG